MMLGFNYKGPAKEITEQDIDSFITGLWKISIPHSDDREELLSTYFSCYANELPQFFNSKTFKDKLVDFSLHVLDDFLRTNDSKFRTKLIYFHDAIRKNILPDQIEQNWVSLYNTLFNLLIDEQVDLCNEPLTNCDHWRKSSSVVIQDDHQKVNYVKVRINSTLAICHHLFYLLDVIVPDVFEEIGLHFKNPPLYSRQFLQEQTNEAIELIEHLLKGLISSYVLATRYQVELSGSPFKTKAYLEHMIRQSIECLMTDSKSICSNAPIKHADFQTWLHQYDMMFKKVTQTKLCQVDLSQSKLKSQVYQMAFDRELATSDLTRLTQRYHLPDSEIHPAFLAKIDKMLSKMPNPALRKPTTVMEGLEMLSMALESLQQKNELLESAFGQALNKASEAIEQYALPPSRRSSFTKAKSKKYSPGQKKSDSDKKTKKKGADHSKLR